MNNGNIENNIYAKILYDKPEIEGNATFWKKIAYHFKLRSYTNSTIKPLLNHMRNNSPTFSEMCEFSDFIRILEKVMFYKNSFRKVDDTSPKKVRLLSDNPIDGSGEKKTLIMDLEQEGVTVIFTMFTQYNSDTCKDDECISEKISHNTTSKGLHISFTIINREVEFQSKHDWVMASRINQYLQNAMADLFLEYYKLL